MNLLLHLMSKDGWAARVLGFIVLLCCVGLACLPIRGPAWQGASWELISFCLSFLIWLMVALLIRAVLNLDPALDSSSFISTRPVSRGQIIISKLMVTLGVGALPFCLASMARLWRSGVEVGGLALAGITLENMCLLTAVLGVLTLPLVLPRRHVVVDLLSLILACLLVAWGVSEWLFGLSTTRIRHLIALGLGWGCMSLVVCRYLHWSFIKSALAASLLSLVGAFLAGLPTMLKTPTTAAVDKALQVKLGTSRATLTRHAGMRSQASLNADVQIHGLPEGIFAECAEVKNTLIFEGELGEVRTTQPMRQSNGWAVLPGDAYASFIGKGGSHADNKASREQPLNLSLGYTKLTSAELPASAKATLRGTLVLNLYQTVFVQSVPFHEGAEWSGGDIHLKLSQISRSRGDIQMAASSDILWLHDSLRRQMLGQGIQDYGFFGVDEVSREIFRLDSVQGESTLTPLLRHQQCQEITRVSLLRNWWPGVNDLRAKDPARPLRVEPDNIALGVFQRVKVKVVEVPYEWQDVTVQIR